jgi:hypothetical protein
MLRKQILFSEILYFISVSFVTVRFIGSSERHFQFLLKRFVQTGKQTVRVAAHTVGQIVVPEKLTQNEKYAKKMVKVRSKTVEPVIGTLVNFTNMKRVNTRGIKNANKHVLMASLTYNLKKYLRFTIKKPSVLAQVISLKQGKNFAFIKSVFLDFNNSILSTPILSILTVN